MGAVNMKATDYYKSGRLQENCLKAIDKANQVQLQAKKAKIIAYNTAPSKCTKCNTPLEYSKRKNLFCSKSCAVSFNNQGRVHTEISKEKTSKKLIGRKNPNSIPPIRKKHEKVLHICAICGIKRYAEFVDRGRKTCGSEACIVHAKVGIRTLPNGRRKLFWVYNPTESREVLLESSWELELAHFLFDSGVKWTRPAPIKWIDNKGKNRFYYPDFYLPDFNIYLDPKNPYGMVRDKNKISVVYTKINLIVGNINYVKDYIKTKILSVA